jgi:hypothetical protein
MRWRTIANGGSYMPVSTVVIPLSEKGSILLLKATVALQIYSNLRITITLAFYPIYWQQPQPPCPRPTNSVWLADSRSGPTKHSQPRDWR